MTINLSGQTILVTRLDPAGSLLCQEIIHAGGSAIHLPTISIAPPSDKTALREGIACLGDQDWLIFISPQAVYQAATALRQTWPNLPSRVKFAAQGEGTALALQEMHFPVALYPTGIMDSEALLALSAFKDVKGQKIAVLRGEGGRALIGKTLAARGAKVMEVLVYKRELPQVDISTYLNKMQTTPLNVIVSSSFESIHNLKIMIGAKGWSLIQHVPVIVMSERVKKLTEALDFKTVWVIPAKNPTALLRAIAQRGK